MSIYISNLLSMMLIFLPIYCAGRAFRLWSQSSGRNPAREITLAVFVLFMLGLLTLTFQNGLEWMQVRTPEQAWIRLKRGIGVNLVPFRTIRTYIKYSVGVDHMLVNVLGNILMFVPWGLGLPLLWKKYQSCLKVMAMSLVLPMGIEFCQLFIGRSVDIDDVILNFLGGMLGWVIYRVLVRIFPRLKMLAC